MGFRPDQRELEAVRANSKVWSWLKKRRGELRQIEEAENIKFEDELFILVDWFHQDKANVCPVCGKNYVSKQGVVTHSQQHHRNFFRAFQLTRKVFSDKKVKVYSTKPVGWTLPTRIIQKQKSVKPLKRYDWDEYETISNYNRLIWYLEDPESNFKMRRSLVKAGLIDRIGGRDFVISSLGKRLLANPPTIT